MRPLERDPSNVARHSSTNRNTVEFMQDIYKIGFYKVKLMGTQIE